MKELNVDQFWADDLLAHQNNCFNQSSQIPLGIRMSDECVFDELGEEGTPWMPIPRQQRIDLNKRYNDKAERLVGKRLLQESFPPQDANLPAVKRIGEVFGGQYIYHNETEWLTRSVHSYNELETLLDQVERMDLRAFMLPENWEKEKRRVHECYGIRPALMRHIRGPVTLACSIMGTEQFLFLIIDEPDLARRFSHVITKVTLEMAAIMDEEAGTDAVQQPGFSFADDNCCLLSPPMYELFGYPVLKEVFARYSPGPEDKRYQHSDSAMGHLLPLLGSLQLNGVNFGPTVLIPEIRKHLPRARIDGCLSPMTFMRNDREGILREVQRDLKDALVHNGVNISTAGSINNGSSLESMRLVMQIIQNYGRRAYKEGESDATNTV
ncbi:MAG TPA: uroporphyrinogen decarboxylase family protein [Clostridia bacterium]|nr:uroporphyrinogen decarboxylase family protein [Clostridia bacterium]HQO55397.1 uroporphyrinogen decarboxylase family protein [Clostridia bacterium]